MAWQLIFTSAPAGLNPGSSGYCTVGRSPEMREAVAARLEQWSVYTRPARGTAPVICAYRILDVRGTIFHVLTRIVDSGLDYTGRTNFLAHHLVVQPHEIDGAPVPPDIFLKGPFWQSQWSGNPRALDDVDLRGLPRRSALPARNWEGASGDARRAALLVNDAADAAQSADCITQPGQEEGLLLLFGESLCLLDAEPGFAWSVPFTTSLQTEDDPADFRWRGLWTDNRQNPGSLRLDFTTGDFPPPPDNAPARHARTGRKPLAYAPPQTPAAVALHTETARSNSLVSEFEQSRTVDLGVDNPPPKRPWPLVAGVAVLAIVVVAVAGIFVLPKKVKQDAQSLRTAETPSATIASATPEPTALPTPEPSVIAVVAPEPSPVQAPASTTTEPIAEKHVRDPAYAAIDPGEAVYVIDVSGNDEQAALHLRLPAGNPIAKLIERRIYSQFRVAISTGGAAVPISLWHSPETKYFGLTYRTQDGCLVLNTDDKAITDRDFAFGNTAVQMRREIKTRPDSFSPDAPEATLISFVPKNPAENSALQAFHLLIVRSAGNTRWAPLKLPRGLLEARGNKLQVKSPDDLRACLAKWLDQNGKPIAFELQGTFGGSFNGLPLGSGVESEIDFGLVRDNLSRKYSSASSPSPAPISFPPNASLPAANNPPTEQIKNLTPSSALDPRQARLWIDKAGGLYRLPLIEFVVPPSR